MKQNIRYRTGTGTYRQVKSGFHFSTGNISSHNSFFKSFEGQVRVGTGTGTLFFVFESSQLLVIKFHRNFFARFLRKNERMSDSLKKRAIHSSLIFGERPERIAHGRSFVMCFYLRGTMAR